MEGNRGLGTAGVSENERSIAVTEKICCRDKALPLNVGDNSYKTIIQF